MFIGSSALVSLFLCITIFLNTSFSLNIPALKMLKVESTVLKLKTALEKLKTGNEPSQVIDIIGALSEVPITKELLVCLIRFNARFLLKLHFRRSYLFIYYSYQQKWATP
jgi:hypothetical protein